MYVRVGRIVPSGFGSIFGLTSSASALATRAASVVESPVQAAAKQRSRDRAIRAGLPGATFDVYDRAAKGKFATLPLADYATFSQKGMDELIAKAQAANAPPSYIDSLKNLKSGRITPEMKQQAIAALEEKGASAVPGGQATIEGLKALKAGQITPELKSAVTNLAVEQASNYVPGGGTTIAVVSTAYEIAASGKLTPEQIDSLARDMASSAAAYGAAAACSATGVGVAAAPLCGWAGGKIGGEIYDAGKRFVSTVSSWFGSDDSAERAAKIVAENQLNLALAAVNGQWNLICLAYLMQVAKAYNGAMRLGLVAPPDPTGDPTSSPYYEAMNNQVKFCFAVKDRVGAQQWIDDSIESGFAAIAGTYRTCFAPNAMVASDGDYKQLSRYSTLDPNQQVRFDIRRNDWLLALTPATERLGDGVGESILVQHNCPPVVCSLTEAGVPPWALIGQVNSPDNRTRVVQCSAPRYAKWLSENLLVPATRWTQIAARASSVKLYVDAVAARKSWQDQLAQQKSQSDWQAQLAKQKAEDDARAAAAQREAALQSAGKPSSGGALAVVAVAVIGIAGVAAFMLKSKKK